jgi:glycosyltransferase involved in cell wall biosynthesis
MSSLVSVLIPTYNREAYIEKAVRSAMMQTHEELEIIICDNCSTDRTVAILEKLAASDHRLRLYQNPENLGGAFNFRRLLSLARGNYVKFLMSDDLLRPTCVERLLAPLRQDSAIALATSQRQRIDGFDRPLGDIDATQALALQDVLLDGREAGELLLRTNLNYIGEPTTTLFRRSEVDPKLSEFAGVEYRYNGDIALWLSLLRRGALFYAAERLSCFRVHDGQDQQGQEAPRRGTLEWFQLIEGGQREGFFRGSASEVEAIATCQRNAVGLFLQQGPAMDSSYRHELSVALARSGSRLSALIAGGPPLDP